MQEFQERVNRWMENDQRRYPGKYEGKVISNNLADGALEVIVPDILDEQTIIALPSAAYAGNQTGIYMIPEVDSLVWIEFQRGNLDDPIWTGCFWADGELPVKPDGQEVTPGVKMIRSQKGLTISLDDDNEIVTISDKNSGNVITIDVASGKVKIEGKTEVVIQAKSVKLGGDNASQPVVKGNALWQYLSKVALTAKPKVDAIPIPFPPLSILSNDVTTT